MTAVGLTACDPAGPFGVDGGAEVSITINADGGAETQLFLDARVRSHAELTRLGEGVAPLLFPTATRHSVVVDKNSGGYPFASISTDGVYQPGPRPRFSLDARPTVSFLLDNGFRSVDVSVSAPQVPVTATWTPSGDDDYDSGSWYWDTLESRSVAPVGSIEMSPETWRAFIPLALLPGPLGLVLFAGLALRRRRRVLAATASLGSGLLALGVGTVAEAIYSESLGVAGILSGFWLTAASLAPLLVVPIGLVAFAFFIAALAIPPTSQPTIPPPPARLPRPAPEVDHPRRDPHRGP